MSSERKLFEASAAPILGDKPNWRESGDCELMWFAWQAARTQPATPDADWRIPTTHVQRIADAMQLLCAGQRPSDEIVAAWLDADADDMRLQNFAAEHGPAWAQGIGLIDAARVLADQPTEGVDHEFATPAQQGEPPAVPAGFALVPIEPTDAMALAAVKASLGDRSINGVALYRAMLAAAPQPEPPTPVPVICGNCDTALPEGCGGVFKDDGSACKFGITGEQHG